MRCRSASCVTIPAELSATMEELRHPPGALVGPTVKATLAVTGAGAERQDQGELPDT